ncbi:rhomboid family intramembrane serine protease GlpG [Vibrio sp. V27_P1S3P104]|uniref:rhomboid family intramembrane serine protease GlpG n=1 Tax=Vibrio TaxID=662 RepID=UPI000C16CF7D|nr:MULTISPECIES: rhomboid family intramembrane serine protease GlpG [Vibrio]NAW68902.1 rhomboid family intramembrane serine protease GlpG [Vibrio sp. V28_P6S34P95]NAX03839.1 rhomboid family intramembrane serine protease GlpG [Vibrio sp. V30_P3S12P165]NAX35852.1 rhomboid family intramembrane serine protease GlpG [Vibrio sp. V29_P1S30P107]NAX36173.1 rhomboid family intramembrane serine protease GlpG [Vibrio sp. V27_P1S3P104]NAX41835.1 rhomboid family intramembrane serine protease GlpG [Vibrio sp
MIKLITLNNPRMAQSFIDYMASRQIEVQMEVEEGELFSLWLMDEQHWTETESELKQFLRCPQDSKYQAASWDVAETRKPHFYYASPSLFSLIKAKAGPITLLVMLVCVANFTLQQFGWAQQVFAALHFPAVADQKWQLWRWFSHALLHFSVIHITFNLLWWWQLGGDIEKRLGSGKVLQIFLISAALSGAGQYWVEGANFGGLSGVVYALVGYLWIVGWRVPELGLTMPKPLIGFMLVWLILGFVQPFMAIANSAHLAGLICGLLLGWLDIGRLKKTNQKHQ